MKKSWKILLVVFVLAVAALYVAIFVVPGVTDAMRKTTELVYGSLPIFDTVEAYVVRDETVYMASRSGEIRYYVGEGVKLRKGALLLDIVAGAAGPEEPEESAFAEMSRRIGGAGVVLDVNAAPEGGQVSYYIDGYETLFSEENMTALTRRKAAEADGKVVNVTRHDGFVRQGEPLYKLADNTYWHMVFWLDKDAGSIVNYEEGESVTVVMPNGEVKGKVQEIVAQADAWMLILRFDRYYENLAQIRKTDATIVVADYRGLLIENASIAVEGGQTGVYVRRRSGAFEFVPVNVVRSDGVHSVLSMSTFVSKEGKETKTVNVYEEVLQDPSQIVLNGETNGD
ncbi:MAG: hypothetical protein LBT26_06160 [Clostridiales Family XIII bacterium]|jgi:putative membrane fusion protein|nr:hypothetical protein [Clostridiales Family XIII bacterium]